MKIKTTKPYVIEGQIIEEGVSLKISEKIFGNMASAYHRTDISDLINKVYTSGFKPGTGDMYGKAFYGTYELDSQERERMEHYGEVIVKFFAPIENFFVFDRSEFEKSPLSRKLNLGDFSIFSDYNFLYAQADYFDIDTEIIDAGLKDYIRNGEKFTSDIASIVFDRDQKSNHKKVQGIVFTGRNDGKTLVCYDTDILVPQSYKMDGEDEFKRVERNMEYLRKVVQKKTGEFTPDLSMAPEDIGITKYEWKDGKLNVFEDVFIKDEHLIDRRLPFQFGVVNGYFSRYFCENLVTLKGAPQKVGGSFHCSECKSLISLEGAPEEVGGDFGCYFCENLVTLKGAPEKIVGDFNCSYCDSLTSLEGAPREVGGEFSCSDNDSLISLKGAPREVGGKFDCSRNKSLISLEGSPENIGGHFVCKACTRLTSIKGAPEEVIGDFSFYANGKDFTEEEIKEVSNVGGEIIIE